jgi:membrane-associated protein
MSIISSVIDEILKLHGIPAYALVGGLAFSEAALFVGFVLPGETAVLLGGVLANQHRVSLVGIAAVAVLAAIIGDSVGYEVGRHFGTRLLDSRVFERRKKGIERGKEALRANGGRAVFFARFTAFLRAIMPGLAGTVRMPYRRFLAFNAAGGLIWAVGFTLLGYLAGAGYHTIETIAGRASEVILAVIVVGVVTLVIIRRRRERDPAPDGANGPSPSSGPDAPSPSDRPAAEPPRDPPSSSSRPGPPPPAADTPSSSDRPAADPPRDPPAQP